MPKGSGIDVTASKLVPKHEVMSKKEEEELVASLKINKNQLPKIRVTDQQCKQLNAKIGDVLKISRTDLGPNFYYRRVVK